MSIVTDALSAGSLFRGRPGKSRSVCVAHRPSTQHGRGQIGRDRIHHESAVIDLSLAFTCYRSQPNVGIQQAAQQHDYPPAVREHTAHTLGVLLTTVLPAKREHYSHAQKVALRCVLKLCVPHIRHNNQQRTIENVRENDARCLIVHHWCRALDKSIGSRRHHQPTAIAPATLHPPGG